MDSRLPNTRNTGYGLERQKEHKISESAIEITAIFFIAVSVIILFLFRHSDCCLNAPLSDNQDLYKNLNKPVVHNIKIITFPEIEGPSVKDMMSDEFPVTLEVHFSEDISEDKVKTPNASMRLRGHSTRFTAQKSLKIHLEDGVTPWRNHKTINLNKHPYDLTSIRNKLSFDLISQIPGLLSLTTLFTHVTIDYEDYGLFTAVENVNRSYFRKRGLDPDGHIYKAEQFEFERYPEELRSELSELYDKEAFERRMEIKGSGSHNKLLEMLNDINDGSKHIDYVIRTHFNRENYLTWLALNILTGNMDTVSQNFFLYSPHNSDIWHFIPWDYDGAWGFFGQEDQKAAGIRPPRTSEGIHNWMHVILHKRFLKIPENMKMLMDKIEILRKKYLNRKKIAILIDSYRPIATSFARRMPDIEYLPVPKGLTGREQKLQLFQKEIERLKDVVDNNYNEFIDTLPRPVPFFMGNPQLENETMTFYWNKSFVLTGEKVSYDFQINYTSDFPKDTMVIEKKGITDNFFSMQLIEDGEYFYRIVARSDFRPDENWQLPVSETTDPDTGKIIFGMKRFKVKNGEISEVL